MQVAGELQYRLDNSWGYLINDRKGNAGGRFDIVDSLNSMVLGLDYPQGETIMLAAQPKIAFISY